MTPALLAALALSAWTPLDTGLELAFTGLVVADAALTHHGLAHGLSERNPLLGRHPTPGKVWALAAAGAVAHAGVSMLLPERWRRVWQAGTLAVEFSVVAGNVGLVLGGQL